MAGERTAQALARIDAAAHRIEVAARLLPTGGDPELQEKYNNLRIEAGVALAELDRLIGMVEK